jgi:hypothetical protein
LIKVERHPLLCDCEDCAALFPSDRFEASWPAPKPPREDIRPATAGLPIGASSPAIRFTLWLDESDRLACDWPGLPGTIGARVNVRRAPAGSSLSDHVTGTDDVILAGFSDGAPLRRKLTGRLTARLMVEFGLAPPDTADYVPCSRHTLGVSASTCAHLQGATERRDAVMLYGVDGDFPDLFCEPCLKRLNTGDLSLVVTTCSRCLATLARHHRLVGTAWYGQ